MLARQIDSATDNLGELLNNRITDSIIFTIMISQGNDGAVIFVSKNSR